MLSSSVIVVNQAHQFWLPSQYKAIRVEHNVMYEETTYALKITYEKKLSVIYRLAIGILAVLAMATLVPFLLRSALVLKSLKQAVRGVDQKIVFIKNSPNPEIIDHPVERQVRWKEMRVREFRKMDAPVAVGDTDSFVLAVK
jgi:hypothetical protein